MSVAETETAALPAAHAPVAGPPVLRLLPAPPCAPPYDDELPSAARPLRLVPAPWSTGAAEPAVLPLPSQPPPLRVVPPALDEDDDDWPARTALSELPPPQPFAHALVQRLLEVMAGLRPLAQLQRDTTFELFTQLEQTVGARRYAHGTRPTRRDVRSVHVQTREDGVAEVCATVRRGGRATALAFRLEGIAGGWRCTALVGV